MAAYENPQTVLGSGRQTVTTGGTEVQLTTTVTKIAWVVVTAETDNTGNIAVGDSAVVAATGSERGAVLGAGDAITLPVNELSKVYIDATVNGDGVTYLYGV